MTKLEHAIRYASHGFLVHPLKVNSKEPIGKWKENATNDESVIRYWWGQNTDYNIGVCTNSSIIVLDVDYKNGKDGYKSLMAISDGEDLNTLTVITPTGGRHLYYKNVDNVPVANQVGFMEGLDLLAENHYAVGAGSTIDGTEYSYIDETVEIKPIPAWLLEHCKKTEHQIIPSDLDSSIPNRPLFDELKGICPDLPYAEWVEVLFAALNSYGYEESVINMLEAWSSNSYKFVKIEFDKKIKSHNPEHPNKAGIGKLRYIRDQYPVKAELLFPKITSTEATDKIILESHQNTVQLMEEHGNQLSDSHKEALYTISKGLVHGALSGDTSRLAYPLPTGMGKTTAVKGFIKAICDLNLPISLLIAAENIAQLNELKEELVEYIGVPSSKVGILHSSPSKWKNIKSIKVEAIDHCQFLLVAHKRMMNDYAHESPQFFYKGVKRDLVIWDESLITTSGQHLPCETIIQECSAWRSTYDLRLAEGKQSKHNGELLEALYEFFCTVEKLMKTPSDQAVIDLPCFEHTDYEQAITTIYESEMLIKLIMFSQQGEMRKVITKHGSSFVRYSVEVPDEINKIAILDASAVIRKLVQYDQSITIVPLKVEKDYSSNTIHYCRFRSSKSCLRDKDDIDLYLKELRHLLTNEIPLGKEFLILTFKDLDGSKGAFKKLIQDQIADLGLNFKDRAHIATWGSHKGVNTYRNVEYVITVGILYRDTKELAANIIGQSRDMNYLVTNKEIHETQCSEQADLIYQGISRGNSRNTINGVAGQMTVYLIHNEPEVLKYLGKVMPNVSIQDYQPKYLVRSNSDWWTISNNINEYLEVYDGESISIKKLKKAATQDLDSNSKAWRKAIENVESTNYGWMKEGKSLVKAPF